MRNNETSFPFGLYRTEAFYLFFWYQCHTKCVIGFALFFSWPRWPIDLKLLQVCPLMCMADYIKCLAKTILYCSLNDLYYCSEYLLSTCCFPFLGHHCLELLSGVWNPDVSLQRKELNRLTFVKVVPLASLSIKGTWTPLISGDEITLFWNGHGWNP